MKSHDASCVFSCFRDSTLKHPVAGAPCAAAPSEEQIFEWEVNHRGPEHDVAGARRAADPTLKHPMAGTPCAAAPTDVQIYEWKGNHRRPEHDVAGARCAAASTVEQAVAGTPCAAAPFEEQIYEWEVKHRRPDDMMSRLACSDLAGETPRLVTVAVEAHGSLPAPLRTIFVLEVNH